MDPAALSSSQAPSLSYSEKGVSLAKSLVGKADLQAQPEKSDELLLSGLAEIEKSPETTADEKLLARLVTTIDKGSIKPADAAKAGLSILNAIASSMAGPATAAIANTAVLCSRDFESPYEKNAITSRALTAISQHGDSTPVEQAFAAFAGGFSTGAFSGTTVDRIHREALGALASSAMTGPAAALCGSFALKIASDPSLAGNAYGESALHSGLKYIYKDESCTAGQRSLAYHGLVAHLDPEIPYVIKNTYLEVLTSTPPGELPRALAKASLAGLNRLEDELGKNFFLYWGLKTISENPDAPTIQKSLAADGTALFSTVKEGRQLMGMQSAVLETIAALDPDAEKGAGLEALRALKEKLGGSHHFKSLDMLVDLEAESQGTQGQPAGGISSDDDFVTIGGVKLKVQRFLAL
ncbi:MAG: hypothetical protein RDV48_00610 [Candidatus Eremiobacteraeota bacterium]|nr:hypothetical protein [Candidatus Eremiobacteraeota bacterium]